MKRIEDDESDDEVQEGQERDAIANVLFEGRLKPLHLKFFWISYNVSFRFLY